ncbi:inositol monophosphatase family protein [Stygiolobus caldivivus]|uniref:Extragenic suppressor protein suhB n=1 Tax=Stygiolobus caldivivus TaxID=2824673 RepID=A0A8D5U5P1_9CREN|nr:inositol monophosphatase family protein [Stygiolobus caldivivus]BCU69530.1 extragenic suppressor protein suhB [Stygiolobus caldivivus]
MKREEVVRIGTEVAKFLRERKDSADIGKIIATHDNDITRKIDKESEDYIFELMRNTGYKFKFISEESGTVTSDGYEYKAIIDPIDGSTNFVSGIPWSSVSIAVYKSNEVNLLNSISGVITNIFTLETFSYDDKSSYINNRPIVQVNKPEKMLILAYFSRNKFEVVKDFLSQIKDYKLRSLGSASLDMVLVCLGKATMFFDIRGKLRNVDIAASSNFCSRLGIIPQDKKLQAIESSLEKVSVLEEVILSLEPSLSSYLSSALQKV